MSNKKATITLDYYGGMDGTLSGKPKLKAETVITDERTYALTMEIDGLRSKLEGLTHKQAEAFCKELAKQLGGDLVYPESLEDALYRMDYK